jgi:quinol monooxygenase YgiN
MPATSLLFEEGGNMAVFITTWKTRQDCLNHHSSRLYRQFVQKTAHLLAGNYIVKLFRQD